MTTVYIAKALNAEPTASILLNSMYIYNRPLTDAEITSALRFGGLPYIDIRATVASTNSNKVTIWRPFAQSDANLQPTQFSLGGYRNTWFINFNSSSCYLRFMTNALLPVAANGGFTIGLLYKINTTGVGWDRIIQGYMNDGTEAFSINRYADTSSLMFQLYDPISRGAMSSTIAPNGWVLGTWSIVVCCYNATTKTTTIHLNNMYTPVVTQTTTTTKNNILLSRIDLGNLYGSVGNQFDLGGLVMYHRAVSETDVISIFRHFGRTFATSTNT